MSDISTKLTYLNTTKTNLKDMINNGLPSENQITNQTTFRNYVSSIFEAFLEALRNPDTLFNNLPKTSGSGSNITLNGTANAPMRITLNPTALSQDGTPTPTYPQDIHTISGNNTIQVDGENLCNTFIATKPNWQAGTLVVNNDGSFTISDNTGSNNYFQLNQKLKELCPSLKNGDTAYLYLDTTNANKKVYISGMGGSGWFSGNSLTITDTLLNSAFVIYGGYNQTDTIKISITKGQVATSYKEYIAPQTTPINLGEYELGTIGDYEDRIFKNVVGDTDYSSEREEGAWYYKQGIGKVVLDGSETQWVVWFSTPGAYSCSNYIQSKGDSSTINCISNYFSNMYSRAYIRSKLETVDNVCCTSGGELVLVKKDSTTLSDFKNWLSNNNVTIYTILETPTYTKITGELANQLEQVNRGMLSYDGTTNISQVNNDLAFVINASGITK